MHSLEPGAVHTTGSGRRLDSAGAGGDVSGTPQAGLSAAGPGSQSAGWFSWSFDPSLDYNREFKKTGITRNIKLM